MPALGESVTEGTVTRWLKQVGDTVEADEPLLEVSTDKVDTEIPSPVAGTLLEIKVAEDETAAVGAELAVIGAADGAPAPAAPADQLRQRAQPRRAGAGRHAGRAAPAAGAEAPRRSRRPRRARPPGRPGRPPAPAAARPPRRAGRARRRGQRRRPATSPRWCASSPPSTASTWPSLTGTGVGGRIRKQDVLEAAEQAKAPGRRAGAAAPAAGRRPRRGRSRQPSPLRGRTEKLSRLRALIARRMVESLQVSAQLTTVVEVDVTRIARLRDQAKADFLATHGVKLSFLPFFALAAVEALRRAPDRQRLDRPWRRARSPTTTPSTSASRSTPSAA